MATDSTRSPATHADEPDDPPPTPGAHDDAERRRLRAAHERGEPWYRWGPYLSERQWGTVREDYSPGGTAWDYFPHDHARSQAYRWGEDGIFGICDDQGLLCFALTLWNEADPILKERLFGLGGTEGNHGEDVKEYYYYLDNTPTHSYMRAMYRYPQRPFPYGELVAVNRARGRDQPEYELVDTGVFADDRYFDVEVAFAKVDIDDIMIRLSATNHGPDDAPLHLLPTLWYRNTWDWSGEPARPSIAVESNPTLGLVLRANSCLGTYWLSCQGAPRPLFTDNESNAERLWGAPNGSPYVKDAFHVALVHGDDGALNPRCQGTKAAAHYALRLAPGERRTIYLRLSAARPPDAFTDAEATFERRAAEADDFYRPFAAGAMDDDARLVQRQAFAGLLWSKQFYDYDVARWLDGDPGQPPPPIGHTLGRNSEWRHLTNANVMSMPDTWEYPWYASWDLAFHCIPLALIDPQFAKRQLILLLKEWFMHPNGQVPAYEWAFGDANPPVHAWAAWRVYKIERRVTGTADRSFLERVFHKLLLNFTWWVNRKDRDGRNVFQGGFLGLDNIGVFDRSAALPTGGYIEQSDGTAWMGMYCLNMLAIALELARENHAYEDLASKFFEHFLYIAGAMNNIGGRGVALWDDGDEFFYDVLRLPDGRMVPLKVRSLVGLMPLLAVETIEPDLLEGLPYFKGRMEWFLQNRPELASLVSRWNEPGAGERRLLALVRGHRMKRLLRRMLDPNEFLSDHGVRALSKFHLENPFVLDVNGTPYTVRYEPAESASGLFGGNSNWRGPVWFPVNYLLIESIQKFHHYYSDDFLVECPTGSGELRTLWAIADELSRRLTGIFLRDAQGHRAVFGASELFQNDPRWRDYIPFYEYFHGDTGAGLGASHQTGWTAIVAKLLEQTSGS